MDSLLVIDIAFLSFEDIPRVNKLVEDIGKAVTSSGFFYLKIDDGFGEKCSLMLDACKQFFALPPEEILKTQQDSLTQMKIKGLNPFSRIFFTQIIS